MVSASQMLRGTLYPATWPRRCSWSGSRSTATPGPQRPEPRHTLAKQLIGDADDQRVEHVGVGLQRAFHFLGEDLLPACVHAGVAAAEQRYGPVVLDPGQVTGHRVALPRHLGEHGRGPG